MGKAGLWGARLQWLREPCLKTLTLEVPDLDRVVQAGREDLVAVKGVEVLRR